MGFHRLAFGPSPQQIILGAWVTNWSITFKKKQACYPFLGSDRCICTSLTYPENFKKIYDVEKKLWSFIYQNVAFGENILSVTDISLRKLSVAINWNMIVMQIKIVVFAKESMFGG